jgi:RNA polymerase sigma-70 factor (ECF subfamily)
MAEQSPEPAAIPWPALLREHERWLRMLALARVRDADVADEILQNVALAALDTGRQQTYVQQAAPWLYRVLVRQCLLYQRQQGRRRKLLTRFQTQQSHSPPTQRCPDPLQWLLAHERRQLVQQSLAMLDDRDAEVLLLKYTEGWSYQQIAAHLGVTASTIESRLHRARQRLRAQLSASHGVEVLQ